MVYFAVVIQLVGTRKDASLMTGVRARVGPDDWTLSFQRLREFGLDEFTGVHNAAECLRCRIRVRIPISVFGVGSDVI